MVYVVHNLHDCKVEELKMEWSRQKRRQLDRKLEELKMKQSRLARGLQLLAREDEDPAETRSVQG